MNVLKSFSVCLACATCALAAASSSALGQTPPSFTTHKDVAYDDTHAAQKLDCRKRPDSCESGYQRWCYAYEIWNY